MITSLKNLFVFLSNNINKIIEKVVMAFVFILFLIVIFQVVTRYIFSMGFPWIDETARFLNIWIAFLGASIGIRYSDHVGVAFFTNMIPEKVEKIFRFITRIITVILLTYISRYAYMYIINSTSRTPSLQLSYKWPKAAIFVGFIIMLIHLVRFILEDIIDFANKDFEIERSDYLDDDLVSNIEER